MDTSNTQSVDRKKPILNGTMFFHTRDLQFSRGNPFIVQLEYGCGSPTILLKLQRVVDKGKKWIIRRMRRIRMNPTAVERKEVVATIGTIVMKV